MANNDILQGKGKSIHPDSMKKNIILFKLYIVFY